jgi:hypothetical protein
MADLATDLFKTHGAYGEEDRATFRPRLRSATLLEQRRLSSQPEFTYFVPFLPLAICPAIPDVASEYCLAYGKDVDLVHWKVDRQLIPSLIKVEIDTSNVFGIAGLDGPQFIKFANGIILQDEGTQSIYRLWTKPVRLIEPSVSLSRPAEKILADQFTLHVFCVQSAKSAWHVAPKTPPVDLAVVRSDKQGDAGLTAVANKFWRRGRKTDILEVYPGRH